MGLFDPAHKKMLARSPAYLRESASVWGTFIETALIVNDATNPDIVRALVIGMVALRSAESNPEEWSPATINYMTSVTNNAYRSLQPRDREIGERAFAGIVTSFTELF